MVEYEELMRISENFTTSADGVLLNKFKSITLSQKSGDLIKFYIQQRHLLIVVTDENDVNPQILRRDLKSDLKQSVKSEKMKK